MSATIHVDYQKPSVPNSFQCFAMPSSNHRSAKSPAITAPMVHTHSQVKTRSSANKAPMSQQGQNTGFKPVVPIKSSANRWVPTSTTRKGPSQLDVDSPELVDRKVNALLNKLTMEKFGTISDQIIYWANKSVNEKDGRTLIRVIRLVFEKAIDEDVWSEMYARLCRKMMEEISPEVQDDGIKDMEGKPIRGGHLFRKYLLSRCQEDFERGWFAKEAAASATTKLSNDQATEATREKKSTLNTGFDFEKAKRHGLNLITFIGELFKVRMLTQRIMHECVKKLLGNVDNPGEEKIESLCRLLKTVGQLLDTPKARAHMDVYFTRMKELGKSHNVSTRMQFMLQDVIELRERAWLNRNAALVTIAAVRALAAKEIAAAEEGRRETDRNQEDGPDDWAGEYVLRKASNLSPFGDITNGPPSPSDIFGADTKDSKRMALLQTHSSSNVFLMLDENPETASEASTNPSHSPSQIPSIYLGHDGIPEPAIQHRKPQLLPRSVDAADESMVTPLADEREGAPITMSEAKIQEEIGRYVRAFFAVRNLKEADISFTNFPNELCFRLADHR
ncbi:armadillo-type protein [Suillus bovinus]|uniref:armadillo-type protein n=1 Tax=Suillus bovinus TaxID=48563 RepID=UPI001B861C17|nr:armadillo-type protein [Suillus bovinus]KAG2132279.1 armadillo-type protein [Suillus bovinus]